MNGFCVQVLHRQYSAVWYFLQGTLIQSQPQECPKLQKQTNRTRLLQQQQYLYSVFHHTNLTTIQLKKYKTLSISKQVKIKIIDIFIDSIYNTQHTCMHSTTGQFLLLLLLLLVTFSTRTIATATMSTDKSLQLSYTFTTGKIIFNIFSELRKSQPSINTSEFDSVFASKRVFINVMSTLDYKL